MTDLSDYSDYDIRDEYHDRFGVPCYELTDMSDDEIRQEYRIRCLSEIESTDVDDLINKINQGKATTEEIYRFLESIGNKLILTN